MRGRKVIFRRSQNSDCQMAFRCQPCDSFFPSRFRPSLNPPSFVSLFIFLSLAASAIADGPTVQGEVAQLRGLIASAPSKAPDAVKNGIWALNQIVHKPYRWGGGHGTFNDAGYDCSGTISYFLHGAGLLDQPTPSKALQTWGDPGPGRWITIYARNGHTFAVICGLRLDTTGHHDDEGPRWRDWPREPKGFVARHPKGF